MVENFGVQGLNEIGGKPSQLCHLCNTLLTSNVYEEFIHGN